MATKKESSADKKTKTKRKRDENKLLAAAGMKSSEIVRDMRYGQSVSIEFFQRNAWLLIVIVVAIISLIGLRYKTKTKMIEIKKLTRELNIAESNKLQEKAAYMSLIRETEMRRLTHEKQLGLVFQEQPPYEVELAN
ncbi:MAG: hypothetical protein HDR48_05745 [Bacteroides sp.]|nr:hypothetical protein [Bacteroides sp.]MBD5419518.1 hypothetical protein [Bacteroides sp.]